MVDRASNWLLVLFAVVLLGLLLRPLVIPTPLQAGGEESRIIPPVLVVSPDGRSVYLAQDGNLFRFDSTSLELKARAIYRGAYCDGNTRTQIPSTFRSFAGEQARQ